MSGEILSHTGSILLNIPSFLSCIKGNRLGLINGGDIFSFVGIGISILTIIIGFILATATYLVNSSTPTLNNQTFVGDVLSLQLLSKIRELSRIKETLSKWLNRAYFVSGVVVLSYLIGLSFMSNDWKVYILFFVALILVITCIIIFLKSKKITNKSIEVEKLQHQILEDLIRGGNGNS